MSLIKVFHAGLNRVVHVLEEQLPGLATAGWVKATDEHADVPVASDSPFYTPPAADPAEASAVVPAEVYTEVHEAPTTSSVEPVPAEDEPATTV